MTINYPLGTIDCECLFMGKQKLMIDWVSHGNFALHLAPGDYTHPLFAPIKSEPVEVSTEPCRPIVPVSPKEPPPITFGSIEIPESVKIEIKPSKVPESYISLEKEHFLQIIQAYHNYIKSNDIFDSMWKGIVPPRGMCFFQHRLFAYRAKRFGPNDWLTIHSQTFFDIPCHQITELTIKIEDFEAAWKIIESSSPSQTPFHCVVFG